ncbi:hypothetical protein MKX03_008690 [Papaver bracteatum]|nr:hypothetical protein MKX03_008690 [Papaver bracteatum]
MKNGVHRQITEHGSNAFREDVICSAYISRRISSPYLNSQFEDVDVPDFPRGGGSTLSKQVKKNTAGDNDFGDDIAGKLPRYAKRITLKKCKRDKSVETFCSNRNCSD